MRLSVNERFGMSLVLLARLYRREIDIALKDFGLSEATALPLRQLAERKLVDRIEDKDDRRAKILRLT